jgi:hypothetical protein
MKDAHIWGLAKAVSKLGALERGPCGRAGEARRLTECLGEETSSPGGPSTTGANCKEGVTGARGSRAQ